MAKKGIIGVLTGGGDVPGLNPAIRAVTFRALREGYRVLGLRRGWAGLIELRRDRQADNSHCVIELTEDIVDRAGKTGGTFLHTSRTRPSHLPKSAVPAHLRESYQDDINDVTPEVIDKPFRLKRLWQVVRQALQNDASLGISIDNPHGGVPPEK